MYIKTKPKNVSMFEVVQDIAILMNLKFIKQFNLLLFAINV